MEAANRRNQAGIQQLLTAEQQAQIIITDARNAKLARLKQAKEEADSEIAQYKAQLDCEFEKKLAGSTGNLSSNMKRLDQETDVRIRQMKNEALRISNDVVSMLLKHVTTVRN